MAITSAIATSWKVGLGTATHNHTVTTGHVFKMALIKNAMAGTYNSTSTNYSNVTGNSDEVANGSGYTTAGATITSATPVSSGTTAVFDFTTDPSWTTATFSTDGCMIYNSSASNAAVSVHDFGGTKSPSAGTLQVTFPTADASNAIYRLA